MKTGKQVWKQKFAEWKEGYSGIVAPLVANGVLITGMAGGEFGVRGFLDGWDPETGKKLWRRYTIPGPGEPGYETWPQGRRRVQARRRHRRGSPARTIPQLDLVYWGTGNAGPWNPAYRKGDSLYSASVLAIRPKTGEIVWHYQFTPNDIVRLRRRERERARRPARRRRDAQSADARRPERLLLRHRPHQRQADRARYPFGKVNWATHIDLKTGRPVETDVRKRLEAGEEVELWPFSGTKNWAPMAFNPKTGTVYLNTINLAQYMKYQNVDYKSGARYTGARRRAQASGGRRRRGLSRSDGPAHRQSASGRSSSPTTSRRPACSRPTAGSSSPAA